MTSNLEILAKIQTLQAVRRAQRGRATPPPQRVMDALEAAIEDRRGCLANLALRGQVNTAEYRKAEMQLKQWDAAWRSNR